ncbi:MAG: Xaa-Pro dipeptidase [Kiritimatiellia bacterium]
MPAKPATFKSHVQILQKRYEEILAKLASKDVRIDAVLLHSGSEQVYAYDDAHMPFRALGHFRHWMPVGLADQFVLVQPGRRPVFFEVRKDDFWVDTTTRIDPEFLGAFKVVRVERAEQVIDHLPAARRIAFLGDNTALAGKLGMPSGLVNEPNLRNHLDYSRSLKTDWEIRQIRIANEGAVIAHEIGYAAFLEGASEFEIFNRYLEAAGKTELEQPFPPIVCLDEKASILHYQHRRQTSGKDSKVLLLDAGHSHNGYAADVTRTHVRDNAHPVFQELNVRVAVMMRELINLCKVGESYVTIQNAAHDKTLHVLRDLGIARGRLEQLKKHKISHLFLPHGIGHSLGIQVHDVGGLFKDETGVLLPPPEEHRHLRMTRKLVESMVYTIEPGIYFIPMLLNPERKTPRGKLLDWKLVDQLIPLGGVRHEDNVLITRKGPVNLTAEAAQRVLK